MSLFQIRKKLKVATTFFPLLSTVKSGFQEKKGFLQFFTTIFYNLPCFSIIVAHACILEPIQWIDPVL